MKFRLALSLAVALLLPGCLMGGLRVEEVATSADKPSHVAVYLAVSRSGVPVTGLTPANFRIVEDGQELDTAQTQQTLLPKDAAAVHRALLLLDMSGPVAEGETRARIAEAAARFVTRAHASQPVTVYAFDGGASLRLVGEYPEGPDAISEIPELTSYAPSDPSSNLHSAVIEALSQLDARLMTAQKPIRIGALVVFARGPDLAGRVPEAKMMEALGDSRHLVFAVGLKDTTGFRAGRIGEAGTFEAESLGKLAGTFDEAGGRVADTVGRYYLLSYCSPARAGTRRLKVVVRSTDAEGKETSGSANTQFDASGFGSGCDPSATPRFVSLAGAKEEVPRVQVEAEMEHDERGTPAVKSEKSEKPEKSTTKGKPASSQPAPAREPVEETDEVVPPPDKPGYAQ